MEVDYRALISRADLVYHSPAEVSIEGTPIGNGRMGTNVWTTPRAVRFQVNRNDVISSDRNHAGSHGCPVDYRGPCGRVEVDFVEAVFENPQVFMQRLSLYDAEFVVEGLGVHVRGFVSSACDVLVLEVDDRRERPRDIWVTVPMWRQQEVTTPLYFWNGKELGQEEIGSVLQGPTGMAFGYGDAVVVAKAINSYITTTRSPLTIYGAMMDGNVLTSDQVKSLALLPPKDELLARLIGQMQAPIVGLVNVLSGPARSLVTVLNRIAEDRAAQAPVATALEAPAETPAVAAPEEQPGASAETEAPASEAETPEASAPEEQPEASAETEATEATEEEKESE